MEDKEEQGVLALKASSLIDREMWWFSGNVVVRKREQDVQVELSNILHLFFSHLYLIEGVKWGWKEKEDDVQSWIGLSLCYIQPGEPWGLSVINVMSCMQTFNLYFS